MSTYTYNVRFTANNNDPATIQIAGKIDGTGNLEDVTNDGEFLAGEQISVTPDGSPPSTTWQFAGTYTDGSGNILVVLQNTVLPQVYNVFGNVLDPTTFSLVSFPLADVNTSDFTPCFAAGTPIATPDGETKVEDLKIGDRLLTAYGAVVLVKWVGRQTVTKLFTPPERFRPVRIAAGALGDNVPHVDLVVTADHGIVFDGVVVNAGALVNDTTIVRVPAEELSDRVTYWHVETEDHHVILAAGAPAETFVDNVTRRFFDNYSEYVALYGEPSAQATADAAPGMAELPHPRVMSHRQLPAWIAQRTAERAAALAAAVPEAV